MADVTVKQLDDFDSFHGQFLYAGAGLGVTGWKMNVIKAPPNWQGWPEHSHGEDDVQEEVYALIDGSATLEADGETWELVPGTLARVGPNQKRKLVPGDQGATVLAIGGAPGQVEPRGPAAQ